MNNTIDEYGEDLTLKMYLERTLPRFCDDKVDKVVAYAFYNNKSMVLAYLPLVTSIDVYAFNGCTSMKTLIIGTGLDTACSLGSTNALPSSLTAIYVPDDLLATYQSKSNWSSSSIKSKLKPYSEYTEA